MIKLSPTKQFVIVILYTKYELSVLWLFDHKSESSYDEKCREKEKKQIQGRINRSRPVPMIQHVVFHLYTTYELVVFYQYTKYEFFFTVVEMP